MGVHHRIQATPEVGAHSIAVVPAHGHGNVEFPPVLADVFDFDTRADIGRIQINQALKNFGGNIHLITDRSLLFCWWITPMTVQEDKLEEYSADAL